MIDLTPFGEGLGVIALQLCQPLTTQTIKAHYAGLAGETNAEEWAAFCAVAAKRQGWTFLPGVPAIMDGLRAFRGARPLISEANEAYERVVAAGTYAPEGGTTWSYRAVKEACGRAAAEAFLAAGGNAAFATTWDEGKRRERFAAAYAEAVRAEPTAALLPAGPTKALPSGEAPPTREDAAAVVEKLREMVGVKAPGPTPRVVEMTHERWKELQRQAEGIKATAETTVERRA